MNTWHVGKKDEMEERKLKPGEKRSVLSIYYNGTDHGYELHQVDMTLKDDGALSLSNEDGEGFIYLYPEQVKHLKKLLGGK